MVEITDSDSARAWFETQPREVCVTLAARAALRALPGIAFASNPTHLERKLPLFRALLILVDDGTRPAENTLDTAEAAALAARSPVGSDFLSIADSVVETVLYATRSTNANLRAAAVAAAASVAYSEAAVISATYTALSADSVAREELDGDIADVVAGLRDAPIWRGIAEPPGLAALRKMLMQSLARDMDTWGFWHRWIEATYHGTWRDWDLCFDIATKIPEETWEAGPEAVAEAIRRIEAEHLANRLPLAERLVFDESGRAHVEPIEVQNAALLATSLERVSDLVDDVLAQPSNGLHENSTEIRALRRTVARYVNNPQRIEMDFVQVHGALTRQIAVSRELPASEANLALQSALEESARAIRATHPEVAENRRLLQGQAFEDVTQEDVALLEEALPVLEVISDEDLPGEFREDIREIIATRDLPPRGPLTLGPATRNPGLVPAEKVRVFGRVARIVTEYWSDATLREKANDLACVIGIGTPVVAILGRLVELGYKLMILM